MAYGKVKPVRAGKDAGRNGRGGKSAAASAGGSRAAPAQSSAAPFWQVAQPLVPKRVKREVRHANFMKRLQLPGDSLGKAPPRFTSQKAAPTAASATATATGSSALTSSSLGDLLSSVSAISFNFPGFPSTAASNSTTKTSAPFVSVSTIEAAAAAAAPRSSKPAISKVNRKKLAMQEIAQFSAVLAHPSFRTDALEAVREHLQNSESVLEAERVKQLEFGKSVNRTLKTAHKAQAANAQVKTSGGGGSKKTASSAMQL